MLNNVSSSEFVPLGDWLRGRSTPGTLAPVTLDFEESIREEHAPAGTAEIASFLDEIALLRLRAVESFERARRRLLHRFAQEVLARELQSSPADIEAIAQKALDVFAQESPVSLAVSPADAACLRIDVPVRIDAALQHGDVIVDISDGQFESPLRLRVARIMREILDEEGAL